MAGTKLTNPTLLQTDWSNQVKVNDIQKRGWYNLEFTNMDDGDEPAIAAGSTVDVDGTIYEFEAEEAITGSPADGENYIKITGGASATAVYTTTPPTWDDLKGGWYDGSDRYVLNFVYSSYGSYSFYNKKFMLKDKISEYVVPMGKDFIYSSAFYSVSANNPYEKFTWNNSTKVFDKTTFNNPVGFSYGVKYNQSFPSSPAYGDITIYAPYGTVSTSVFIYTGVTNGWQGIDETKKSYVYNTLYSSRVFQTKPTAGLELNGDLYANVTTGAVEGVNFHQDSSGWVNIKPSGYTMARYFNNSRPATGINGDINFVSTTSEVYISGSWKTISAVNTTTYILPYSFSQRVFSAMPGSPVAGDIFVDGLGGTADVWNGSAWIEIAA